MAPKLRQHPFLDPGLEREIFLRSFARGKMQPRCEGLCVAQGHHFGRVLALVGRILQRRERDKQSRRVLVGRRPPDTADVFALVNPHVGGCCAGRRDVALETQVQGKVRQPRAQGVHRVVPGRCNLCIEACDGVSHPHGRQHVSALFGVLFAVLCERDSAGPSIGQDNLLDFGAQPHLAARLLDHRLHRLRKARRATHRIVGTAVVGPGDQSMLEQRRGLRWRAVVAPTRTEHGTQLRIDRSPSRRRRANVPRNGEPPRRAAGATPRPARPAGRASRAATEPTGWPHPVVRTRP